MSLIEATELAAENVRTGEQQPSLTNSPVLNFSNSILDLEDDEEEKIKAGTSLAISDCGTYAVASKEGLAIYPSRPSATEAYQVPHQEQSDEDVDTLVRFFHLDHFENGEKSKSGELKPPGRLAWGDRVQIVSTEEGWAKLAHGYGFVRADGNQLVKGELKSIYLLFHRGQRILLSLLPQLGVLLIARVNLKHFCAICQLGGGN